MVYAKMSDFRVWHFFCYYTNVVPNEKNDENNLIVITKQ